jgi:hypothetical protein
VAQPTGANANMPSTRAHDHADDLVRRRCGACAGRHHHRDITAREREGGDAGDAAVLMTHGRDHLAGGAPVLARWPTAASRYEQRVRVAGTPRSHYEQHATTPNTVVGDAGPGRRRRCRNPVRFGPVTARPCRPHHEESASRVVRRRCRRRH